MITPYVGGREHGRHTAPVRSVSQYPQYVYMVDRLVTDPTSYELCAERLKIKSGAKHCVDWTSVPRYAVRYVQ